MFKDCASGRGYGSSVPIGVGLGSNEALRDIDRAVAQISQEQRALCAEFYIIGGKSEAIAARMGVSKKKLYANLDSTHSAVKMRLNNFATAW
jgi:DNA-directed RNA polymerase specialized sigma24 family protein